MIDRDYDDVPGTYVLDSRSYRKGYHLNMFCMSLNKAECREEFGRDEMAYLQKFPMTDEQRQAVLDRDEAARAGVVQHAAGPFFRHPAHGDALSRDCGELRRRLQHGHHRLRGCRNRERANDDPLGVDDGLGSGEAEGNGEPGNHTAGGITARPQAPSPAAAAC